MSTKSSTADPPAPHGLDVVIDFVNSLDLETGVDQLAHPPGLAAWLAEKGLLEPSTPAIREAHRERAVRLREALRSLMLAHNGAPPDRRAGGELERVARRGLLSLRFAGEGSASAAALAGGFDGALARLLVPVAEASRTDAWQRVKACRAPDCNWAFYDRSRNRSGVWCDMAVCGNRTKVRAYRSRS